MPEDDDGYPADGSPPSWLSPAELGVWQMQQGYIAKIDRLRAVVRQCLAPGFDPDEDAADGVTVREVILKEIDE